MNTENSLKKEILFISAITAFAILFTAFFPYAYKEWIVIGAFACAFVALVVVNHIKNKAFFTAAKIIAQKSDNIDKYVNSISLPFAVTKKNGDIIWYNPSFMLLAGVYTKEKNIHTLINHLGKLDKDKKLNIEDKKYSKEQMEIQLGNETYYIFRFIDDEKYVETSDLYKIVMGVVMHVQIDNYDDLLRAIQKEEHFGVVGEVEKIIAKTAANVHGFYQQYSKDKFVIIFERRYLVNFMQNKFELLNEVKRIPTTNNVKPTLSIGVGVGRSFESSNDHANNALDLALGRGGDQAVIKEKKEYKFYGGGQQATEKRVRVRSRMFSAALRNLMEQCEPIILMGHKVPDLDCMGSAMGLVACARHLKKEVHIVLDKENAAIDALISEIRLDAEYKNLLVTPFEAERMLEENSMLILLDTQIEGHTLVPGLLEKAPTLVVIDHHLRGTTHISTATLMYHEPYASSTAELVTEIIQYFSDRIKLKPIEAEALLAGITIDTKGFSFKTGVRTFEAASFLRKIGADTTSIRHLFQDDLKTFSARSEVVRTAQLLGNGIAVSICPKDAPNPELLAAQAADSLIGIRGISASFVLCESNKMVVISGRSLGQINVQRILEKLGGGGHSTIAGAQLNVEMSRAKEMLTDAINEFLKEMT
ncbi:MAG: DHH family phosphoesterase [Eubacteriales bacterium]